jgi:hypothetical protein
LEFLKRLEIPVSELTPVPLRTKGKEILSGPPFRVTGGFLKMAVSGIMKRFLKKCLKKYAIL